MQDENAKMDEDGCLDIDLFTLSAKTVEALWEMCSTADLIQASATGVVPPLPEKTGGGGNFSMTPVPGMYMESLDTIGEEDHEGHEHGEGDKEHVHGEGCGHDHAH